MNTIRSTWLGWGVLCVAGGGAYYFAKREINADRQARFEREMDKKARIRRLESSAAYTDAPSTNKKKKPIADYSQTDIASGTHNNKGLDHAGSPSSEASEDVAPVGHAPVDGEERLSQRSKYEAAVPFTPKKGDRFS